MWLTSRTLFITLLALSVGVKLVLGASQHGGNEQLSVEGRVVSFLESHGFHLDEAEKDAQPWAVTATEAKCRLRVAIVSSQGWHREVVRRSAPPGSEVFFVVDGQIYQDQPTWRTRAYYYLRRMSSLVGRPLAPSIILGVVASPDCGWLDGAWSSLRE